MSPRSQIETKIQDAVEAALQDMAAADESLILAAKEKADPHVAFNSSFLFRDKRTVKTLQSSRRLVTKIRTSENQLRADGVSIIDDLALKAHYKFLSSEDIEKTTPLAGAVAQELGSIGDLIFVLIGTVKGLRAMSIQIEGTPVTELRLSPLITQKIKQVEAGVYAIKKILPIEELLSEISEDLAGQGGLTGPERRKIAEAYDELLDDAVTDVAIPTRGSVKTSETILGKIVSALHSQTADYRSAIKPLQTGAEDEVSNEILRIAYNFSTDVLPLIGLFMSICDLKPMVFWCTVDKQWALYRAFAALPWSALGRKEKLEEYQAIVAQARNHAFHHVLPFEATIEADLTGFDVRAEKIRLFSAYGQKQQRGIRLKDQELADVLAEFSRAKERPVSKVFWEGNVQVMQAVCDLAEGILDVLVLLHTPK